jgi:hypothetical protein
MIKVVCETCGGRPSLTCAHDLAQHLGHQVSIATDGKIPVVINQPNTFVINEEELREHPPSPINVKLRMPASPFGPARRPLSWRWNRPPAGGVTGIWREPEDPRCSDCPGVGKGCCVDGFDTEAYAREMGL